MKKLALVLFVTLISCAAFAQKIKIDKKTGLMSMDKVDVAKFESSKNADKQDVYTFTDLNSDASVSLTMIKSENSDENYLEVVSNLTDKTSEMEYEIVNFTLSMNSAISNLIVKKYNFFNTSGMNKEAIISFLAKEDNSRKQALAEKAAKQKAIQDKIDVFSPTLKDNNTVVNKNTGELLAQFESKSGGIIVKDHQANSFAAIKKNSVKENNKTVDTYTMETFTRQTYVLDAQNERDAKMEAINKLILNDYFGGGQNSYIVKKEEVDNLNAQDERRREEYEERSIVNGILTLEDGSTVEGKFQIEFREMADGMDAPAEQGSIASLDGRVTTHYFKDEKGKDKIKRYKEKQVRSFKVLKEDEPDYDEFYTKLTYTQEPVPQNKPSMIDMDGSINVMGIGKSLLGGAPKDKTKTDFVYVGPENSKAALYFSGSNIYINNKKAGKTIILNKENYKSQLKNIAADCESVTENIDNQTYEYSRRSILNFIEELEECK